MGNSRGRWEGDVLVVEVTDHNDRTWLDAAGNFHSNALQASPSATRCATRTRSTTRRRSKTRTCSRGRGRFACRCTAKRSCRGSTSTNARPRRRKRTARSSATRCTWYPAPIPAENAPFDARAGGRAGAAGSHRRDSPRRRRQARPLGLVPARRRRRQLRPRVEPADILDAGEPRPRHRSGRRQAAVSDVGARRAHRARSAAPRLRRSDGALLRRRHPALALRAAARAHPATARLRRRAVRAHVVAPHRDEPAPRSAGPRAFVARRLAAAAGKATRSSSRARTSTAKRGSTRSATS